MLSRHAASESSCPARTLCSVSQQKAAKAANPGPDSHLLQQLGREPALGVAQHRPWPGLSSLQREAYPHTSRPRNSSMIGMGIWSHIRSEAI